ncbi:uncharacterized protein LOC110093389 [Dendrobium catenatum]|uniref:uncharacterized protein LOC110093389 n=1 Tax=Dendrobium catenatum TaxID=906689 RepID=UPI0010A01C29|nr:uncharacterized protein LOC110093389 [Dendrobium catenatum]
MRWVFLGQFTWCNNKIGGARILERLDRCFLNSKAMNFSTNLVLRHLARISSDHSPILLHMSSNVAPIKRSLKFEDIWASYQASFYVVKKEWNKNYSGNPSQIMNAKFRRSLKSLFYWSKAKLRDLNLLKDCLMEEINKIQISESDKGWLTDEECWVLKAKTDELNSTLARLNGWWKQRAKSKWLADGDGNTRFYHSFANGRRSSNRIIKIKNEEGTVVEDSNQIEEVIWHFFNSKWKKRICNTDGWPKLGMVLVMKTKGCFPETFL